MRWVVVAVVVASSGVHAADDSHQLDPKSEAKSAGDSRTAEERLACSAIMDLVRANQGKLPHSLAELVRLLDAHGTDRGGVQRVLIPFTQAPVPSSLARPRVLLTPASHGNGRIPERKQPKHLGMEHRLFTAVSTASDGSQKLEFISWNKNRKGFDFGEVERFGTSQAKLVSHPKQTQQCQSCHKSGGPIFPAIPWSSSSDGHPATAVAMAKKLAQEDPAHYRGVVAALEKVAARKLSGEEKSRLEKQIGRALTSEESFLALAKGDSELQSATFHFNGEDTGLSLFDFRKIDVDSLDASVTKAHSDLRLHEAIAAMPPEQRTAFLRESNRAVTLSLLSPDLQTQLGVDTYEKHILSLQPLVPTLMASQPHLLNNISPSTGTQLFAGDRRSESDPTNAASVRALLQFDAQRKEGMGLSTSKPAATSTAAFAKPVGVGADLLKTVYSASFKPRLGLASVLGLSEADRSFLQSLLPPKGRTGLITEILASPDFEKLAQQGKLPTREQLVRQLAHSILRHSGQKFPQGALAYLDNLSDDSDCLGAQSPPESVAHEGACRLCHVGEGALMPFPFDPSDKQAWAKALKEGRAADREAARALLKKTIARVEDKQFPMPPQQSAEAKAWTAESRLALLKFLKSL